MEYGPCAAIQRHKDYMKQNIIPVFLYRKNSANIQIHYKTMGLFPPPAILITGNYVFLATITSKKMSRFHMVWPPFFLIGSPTATLLEHHTDTPYTYPHP